MRKKIWGVLLMLALCLGALCVSAGAEYVSEGDGSCDKTDCIAHAAVPNGTPGRVWR